MAKHSKIYREDLINNPTSLTREQNLHNWSQIIAECQEAKARGTKVRGWLETRGLSHDAYYYWYALSLMTFPSK